MNYNSALESVLCILSACSNNDQDRLINDITIRLKRNQLNDKTKGLYYIPTKEQIVDWLTMNLCYGIKLPYPTKDTPTHGNIPIPRFGQNLPRISCLFCEEFNKKYFLD
ncbi:MAG: hypothetical protein DWP94_03425 [Flavobacterium sp.]|nr:MAG: hypothetical protein DWP94_03425 [Flavobacterium sp.]